MAHRFKRGEWHPVKRPGAATAKAHAAGESLEEWARKHEHDSNKRTRGEAIFALNARRGKYKHLEGRAARKAARKGARTRARRHETHRAARKAAMTRKRRR